MQRLWSIFWIFLRLGLTSFGGPVAHLGYFRDAFVVREKWLSEQSYAELVALCQFLPGPASSQVGIALGLIRGGTLGAVLAWVGFTLPSALLLYAFAVLLPTTESVYIAQIIHGLKIAAVAVVAQAIWGMGRTLCPDTGRASIAVVMAAILLSFPGMLMQVGVILLGAICGRWLLAKPTLPATAWQISLPYSKRTAWILLATFSLLLLLLPLGAKFNTTPELALFDSFYRSGALVFGGGHVVLPLLQAEIVPAGLLSQDSFLAGYAAAQAVPGPLFTFAAYVGAVASPFENSALGASIALIGIFLPGFLLILAALPFWQQLRQHPRAQQYLMGVNAAVVGLLLAAFLAPMWSSVIQETSDIAFVLVAFAMLALWRWPPVVVVIACALLSLSGMF